MMVGIALLMPLACILVLIGLPLLSDALNPFDGFHDDEEGE